jgi:hypothetical protein
MARTKVILNDNDVFSIVKNWAYQHDFELKESKENYKLYSRKGSGMATYWLDIKKNGDKVELQAWLKGLAFGETDLGHGFKGSALKGPYRKMFNELLLIFDIPAI